MDIKELKSRYANYAFIAPIAAPLALVSRIAGEVSCQALTAAVCLSGENRPDESEQDKLHDMRIRFALIIYLQAAESLQMTVDNLREAAEVLNRHLRPPVDFGKPPEEVFGSLVDPCPAGQMLLFEELGRYGEEVCRPLEDTILGR